jgi:hypothetical protein
MRYIAGILILVLSNGLQAQTLGTFIRSHAIRVELADRSKNDSLLRQLSGYKLIMVGEMHGTQEPAQFVSYLVEQLIAGGGDVQLGIEIPEEMVSEFVRKPSAERLRDSEFFKNGFPDGRANRDWFNLIVKYQANRKVKLFFYDTESGANRDSIMYSHVKQKIIARPEATTVLLGGNFHNRLIVSRSGKPMGVYLLNDKAVLSLGKICAINHHYKYGTMKNSSGQGLQLRVIEPSPSYYSEATPFKAYYSLLPENEYPYTAVFYSEKVTAAEIMNISNE